MLYSMYLSKKQRGVLFDLFSSHLTVEEVLQKRKVSMRTFCRWHGQEYFIAEFDRLLKIARDKAELILARYAPEVAARLVGLTASEKEETARKACLDVITPPAQEVKPQLEKKTKFIPEPYEPQLTPEKASRMLTVINEEKRRLRLSKKLSVPSVPLLPAPAESCEVQSGVEGSAPLASFTEFVEISNPKEI